MIAKLFNSNIVFVLSSQILSFILGFLTAFFLPVFLGIEGYGFWQTYLFYCSFLGVFTLGFSDGIYLNYAKHSFNSLPYSLLKSSMLVYLLIVFLLSLLFLYFSFNFSNLDRFLILALTINILFVALNSYLVMIAQVTNQLKLFSTMLIINKIMLVAIIIVYFLFEIIDFKKLIIGDIAVKFIGIFIFIYFLKELFITKSDKLLIGVKEAFRNIRSGIYILIANLATILIIGLGRFIVEIEFDIEEFAMYSFAISVTSLLLMLQSSLGIVLYPLLAKLNIEKSMKYFKDINFLVITLNILLLSSILPLSIYIKNYLLEFSEVLNYLYLFLLISYFQGKVQLFSNTYLKIFRYEKQLFYFDIITIAILLTTITVLVITNNLTIFLIVMTTLISVIFRSLLAEYYISYKCKINISSLMIIEILVVFIYIILFSYDYTFNFVIYFIFITLYIIINFKKIKKSYKYSSTLFHSKEEK